MLQYKEDSDEQIANFNLMEEHGGGTRRSARRLSPVQGKEAEAGDHLGAKGNKGDHYAAVKKKCYIEKPTPLQCVTSIVITRSTPLPSPRGHQAHP